MANKALWKKVVWTLVRVFFAYVMLIPFLSILYILSITHPVIFVTPIPEFVIWFACFIFVIGYILFRIQKTKQAGKLILIGIPFTLVLLLNTRKVYHLSDTAMPVHLWLLFMTLLFAIMLIYFIFPIKPLGWLMSLMPAIALMWFMIWSIYIPLSLVYEIAISSASAERYEKITELLSKLYWPCIESTLLWTASLIIPYTVTYWGHNPKNTYNRLFKKLH